MTFIKLHRPAKVFGVNNYPTIERSTPIYINVETICSIRIDSVCGAMISLVNGKEFNVFESMEDIESMLLTALVA